MLNNIEIIEQKIPDEKYSAWPAVISHTHMLRHNRISFDEAKKNLVSWCRENDISAVGVGAPWTPDSFEKYIYYEGEGRDRYYAGEIDYESVMDRPEINSLIKELNESASGTVFYLDNESPKNRHGHMWYFGYSYEYPAWHDYCQNRPISFYRDDPSSELNPLTGKPHTRRSYLEVVNSQRAKGGLAIWAHPTSWWYNTDPVGRKQFITNIAAEIVLHLFSQGYLDGMVVQGYDACQRSYQDLWFSLLDTGAIVPGFAENDFCFDDPGLIDKKYFFANRFLIEGQISSSNIVDAARRGNLFCSSGLFLTINVDGKMMGEVAETSSQSVHHLKIEAYPASGEQSISRLDIIGKHGEIIKSFDRFPGGIIKCCVSGTAQASYLIVRAFGEKDNPDSSRQQDIKHMAITNPVYLYPPGFKFNPVITNCRFTAREGSAYWGGELELQTPGGEILARHIIDSKDIHIQARPDTVIKLTGKGTSAYRSILAMENRRVQAILRYLCAGVFLDDFPDCLSGEVPVDAFRIEEMNRALEECEIVI